MKVSFMDFNKIIYLNVVTAVVSFGDFEKILQILLLVISIVLTAIKCVEMIINTRLKMREVKNQNPTPKQNTK